jgi:hypothetical protein
MSNIVHGLSVNGIPKSLLANSRTPGAVYQADVNGDLPGHSLATLDVARNTDYDQYTLWLNLYYNGTNIILDTENVDNDDNYFDIDD